MLINFPAWEVWQLVVGVWLLLPSGLPLPSLLPRPADMCFRLRWGIGRIFNLR